MGGQRKQGEKRKREFSDHGDEDLSGDKLPHQRRRTSANRPQRTHGTEPPPPERYELGCQCRSRPPTGDVEQAMSRQGPVIPTATLGRTSEGVEIDRLEKIADGTEIALGREHKMVGNSSANMRGTARGRETTTTEEGPSI